MKGHTFIGIVSVSIIVAFVIFSNADFLKKLSDVELQAVKNELAIDSQNNISTIRLIFDEYLKPISLMANRLGTAYDIDTVDELKIVLNDLKITGNFISVELIGDDGYSYSSDGQESLFTDIALFRGKDSSEVVITDIYYDEFIKENIISIGVPLPDNGKGYYLIGNLSADHLNKLFENNFTDFGRYFHIIDGNGSYVSTTENSFTLNSQIPFFSVGELIDIHGDFSSDDLYTDFQNKQTGMISYSMKVEKRYMYYEPIGINDWMLSTIITAEIAEADSILYRDISYLMVIKNTLFLASFAFVIVMYMRKMLNNNKTLQDCLETLSQQTNKIIIEWDYRNKTVIPHSDYKTMLGEGFTLKGKLWDTKKMDFIHPDDIPQFTEALKVVQNRGTVQDVSVRIKKMDGEYIWCKISVVFIRNKKGTILKALGFLENIQAIVEETEELKKTAELDLLTGLYNKVTTERLIKTRIKESPEEVNALFIVDFDNFKILNDTFGHAVGDEALKELSQKIKRLFRQTDIVGRVGGDEFFVLLLNYGQVSLLLQKAHSLCSDLRKTYEQDGQKVEITFSVGISLYPNHGTTCTELYKAADSALYEVKKNGKSGYCLFEGEVQSC